MNTAQLLILCTTFLATLMLLVLLFLWPTRLRPAPPRIRNRVTVHTTLRAGDQTFFGVLVGDYADRIVLEDCDLVTAKGPESIPGQQHIATGNIAWIDVHQLVTPLPAAPAAARRSPMVSEVRA